MIDKYKLYIKTDGYDYLRYGAGDIRYIHELIFDYIIKNKMYDRKIVEFKIEKL